MDSITPELLASMTNIPIEQIGMIVKNSLLIIIPIVGVYAFIWFGMKRFMDRPRKEKPKRKPRK